MDVKDCGLLYSKCPRCGLINITKSKKCNSCGEGLYIELTERAVISVETPTSDLAEFEITDVISFDVMTIDTNEVVAHWENPDYKNKKGENNE